MKKPFVGVAVFVALLIGCRDESSLLATTSGSPSYFACPNRLHEMQVQVATHPSSEEAAALVFCKCRREGSP